jgi:methyl-accepting chemotaxis protein
VEHASAAYRRPPISLKGWRLRYMHRSFRDPAIPAEAGERAAAPAGPSAGTEPGPAALEEEGVLKTIRTRDLGLRRKILALAILPTALLVAAFLVVFAVQRSRVAGKVESGVGRLTEETLARAARDLRTLCEATHRELWNQVPRSLRVARDQMERLGGISFSKETVTWSARNQLDGTVRDVVLPKLLVGGTWAGQNADPAKPSLLVDRVRELVGAEATLFQRLNERGDMIRVATTVPDRNGNRAIGTYVPAVDPDGRPNPVVSTVLRGETYRGRARVIDSWYIAGYEPIRDGAGRIAGMLFIGLRQESLEGMRAGVAASRIGESGTLFVLGGSANQRGRYLIPPPGHADGEDAWSAHDADGRLHVRTIVEAALGAAPGQTVPVAYSRASDTGPRARLAAVAYFEPWDWVIVADMDRDEALAPLQQVQSSLVAAVVTVSLMGLLLLAATIAVASRAARRIAAPLEAMAGAAERIAQGDVQQAVTYRSGDEVGRLAEAFRGTISYLQEVARGAAALARGDLSTPLVLRSERDELTRSFQSAQAEVRRLVDETGRLTRAALEGRLEVRADAARYQGDFRKIVEGVNGTLSTLVSHLDAMPTPAMIIGPDFSIRYMNQTGATLLGKTQRELVGTKCYDSFRTGDCRTERCACARAMQQDREVSSETDAHPEGIDLHILYSAVPLRDGEGRVVGGLEVVTDQMVVKREERGPAGPGDEGLRPMPQPPAR